MNYQPHQNGLFFNAGFGQCNPNADHRGDRVLIATHLSGTWILPQQFSDGTNNFAQIALSRTAEGAFYAPLHIGRFH